MLVTEQEKMKQDIIAWVEQFGNDRSSLMPVLQEIQKKYRCISDFAMQEVADILDIHPVIDAARFSQQCRSHSVPGIRRVRFITGTNCTRDEFVSLISCDFHSSQTPSRVPPCE